MMAMYQAFQEGQREAMTTTTSTTTTGAPTGADKVTNAFGFFLSTNFLHLAGLVALTVLLAVGKGPSIAEWSGLSLLVGLGINTNKGNIVTTAS